VRDPQIIVDEARRLFNEGHYWHVHESLEELWLKRQGKEKEMLQGLILVAASLVHAGNGKLDVTWPMMERAVAKLEGHVGVYYGWDVEKFRDHFARVLKEKQLEIPPV
jgi:uncharacterized protein